MHTRKQENKILESMLNELKKSPPVYHPSNFWAELNKFHENCLSESGFENFKRTINYHYFSWGILSIIRHQMSPIFKEILRVNLSPFTKSRFDSYDIKGEGLRRFNRITALIYRIYVASLAEHVASIDKLNILKTLEEPLLGNPFIIEYKNKLISQDLCNSIHEFYSITDNCFLPKKTKIADLGAGYGRLGYIFLNTIPDSSYCVIDIPPALFVSQKYLKAIFSKEKIFLFRPFSSFGDVQKEFESSRIRFLMPHQLELLPNKYFDLFINISSFHEMTFNQILNYINLINKLCRGYFYTKQWLQAQTKDNSYIKESQYPIPKNWETIEKNSPHSIQKMFFDTLYKIT